MMDLAIGNGASLEKADNSVTYEIRGMQTENVIQSQISTEIVS